MIKAIIFDMDGVVLDSIPRHYRAWKQMFKNHGVNYSLEEFRHFNGYSGKETIEEINKKYGINLDLKKCKDEKEEIYLKMVGDDPKFFKDIDKVLKKLRENGYKLALATSAGKDVVDAISKKSGFKILFDKIITADDVIKSKPNPAIFLLSAKKLNANPSECVIIEDAINGIIAAKKAGAKCIAVETSFPRDALIKAGADLIIKDISKLSKKIIEGV